MSTSGCREVVGGGNLVWGVVRKVADGGGYSDLEEDSSGALRQERWLKEERKNLSVARRNL